MMFNRENEENDNQIQLEKLIHNATSGNTRKQESKTEILSTKEQIIIFELLKTMNQGKDGGPVMRVDIAKKQLESMKEAGINIDIIYEYLRN